MTTHNSINTVGRNIKLLRLREDWSQAIIAEKLDLSIPAYSKIETGITDCNVTRIFQIAAVFSVHVTEIILSKEDHYQLDQSDEILRLKKQLEIKEEEIIKLQSRTINLYEQLRDNK